MVGSHTNGKSCQKPTPYTQVLNEMRKQVRMAGIRSNDKRPLVTLSYAQSLDGSLSLNAKKQTVLSSEDSLRITHGLRAMHDGILIGVGTVYTDNPQLTVRLEEGQSPTPIITDSTLRIPLDSNILLNKNIRPIIATTTLAEKQTIHKIRSLGARVLTFSPNAESQVNLSELLRSLYDLNIKSLMVEGGAEILTSFFRDNLVDLIVITIAPQILGGLKAITDIGLTDEQECPRLSSVHHSLVGEDLIIWGTIKRNSL